MDQEGRKGLGMERCNLCTRPYTRVDKASGKPDLSAYGKLFLAAALFVHNLSQKRKAADTESGSIATQIGHKEFTSLSFNSVF